MVSDLDVWRSANLLVKQHGDAAPDRATTRALELERQGAIVGAQIMRRVAAACLSLIAENPAAKRPLN
jgi:hypothetical protein